MTRFPLVTAMSLFCAFMLGINTLAYAETELQRAKNEFAEKFEDFKRDGLSAGEVKQLTEKLLDAAGDDIAGTDLEAMLENMNQQPDRAALMLNEKANVEKLIDIVGGASALANPHARIDEMVELHKSLGEDVKDFEDVVDDLPNSGPIAAYLESYAAALKKSETNIEIIAARAKATEDAINSLREDPNNDALQIADLQQEFQETPTEEEIEWEKLQEDEVAQNEACIDQCGEQYRAYNDIATKRARARDAAAATSKALESARSTMKSKLLNHNDYAKRLNSYLERYRKRLAKRDAEKARMLRAQRENRLESYEGYKQLVSQLDESLTRFRINIGDDFASFKKVQNDYLQTKLDISKNKSKYKSQIRKYKEADALYRIAIKTYEDCVTKCKNEQAALNLNGLWKFSGSVYQISHIENKIRIMYQIVGQEGRPYGHQPGDTKIVGQLNGRSIKGKIKIRYPLSMKDVCGDRWEKWLPIELSVSTDNNTLSLSNVLVKTRDEKTCEASRTVSLSFVWTRVGD